MHSYDILKKGDFGSRFLEILLMNVENITHISPDNNGYIIISFLQDIIQDSHVDHYLLSQYIRCNLPLH